MSDREVTTFLIGKILHAFLISAADDVDGVDWATDAGSKHNKALNLEYSIDYVGKGKIPTEIKTSRSYYPPKGTKDLAMYIEQVLCYMVAEKKTQGKIWVLYLNLKDSQNRTCPEFRCYNLTVSKTALVDYEKQMKFVHTKLIAALKKSKPVGLDNCRQWLCGPRMCPYWDKCKPEGRYEYGVINTKWKN